MPSKTTSWTKPRVVNGQNLFNQCYENVSNWRVLPGTNTPDRTVQNPHTYLNVRVVELWQMPINGGAYAPPTANFEKFYPPGMDWTSMTNEVYAKFAGKLRKGGASLGVTVASWKQSRDMIVDRSTKLCQKLDRCLFRLQKDKGRVQYLKKKNVQDNRESLAGQVLEGEFGWRPLVTDISDALQVFGNAIPPDYITARAKRPIMQSLVTGTGTSSCRRHSWDGRNSVTYSAAVAISNPNLWIANKLGLINLPGVIWDLIPWSFVVNMFTNMNTIVNSVTNEVGLSVKERGLTKTTHLGYETLGYDDYNRPPISGPGFSRLNCKYKERTLGNPAPLSLEFRIPDLNWELAAIATSLIVQRVNKIDRLIRVF